MDGARHHLLAGTRFTEDQHVGIGLGHLADEPTHLLDPLALAHQQPQQRLSLVVGLLTRMEGDEGLAKVQMAGQGFVGEGRLGHSDEVAVGEVGIHQRQERHPGESGQQLAQRAAVEGTGQHPLQRAG